MTLNQAFSQYNSDKSNENKELLGTEILLYLRKLIASQYQAQSSRFEDTISMSFIKIWEILDNFKLDGKATFASFVRLCLRNQCIDEFKKVKEVSDTFDTLSEGPISPVDKVTLNNLINQLSTDRKQLIQLKLEGYEEQEIAPLMNKSLRWVKDNYSESVKQMMKFAHTPEH